MKIITSSAALIASLIAFSGAGLAAIDFDVMQTMTKLAHADFIVAQAAHAQHVTGFKTWLSADDARVKFYVTHDSMTMEFSYLCHVHDEGPECHRQ
jgi:hypothetical protein